MSEGSFLGIDLTSSSRTPTTYAVLDAVPHLLSWGFAYEDAQLLQIIEGEKPQIVAIDTPLSLPHGWHCLEPECGCQTAAARKGRACERELSKHGISSYYTTTKSIIKNMVYRGIKLRQELTKRGYNIIEVYPYASKVRLWGKPIPSKAKPQGIAFLRSKLVDLIPEVKSLESKLGHDLCDALIAAYTAYLHARGETEPMGAPEEGLIWIPKTPR